MSTLAQILLAGLISGAVYALIATAYAVIYTTTGFVNFALGAQTMVAAYVIYVFSPDWPILARLATALVMSVLLAVLTWAMAYEAIARQDLLAAVIASFALAIGLQETVRQVAGSIPQAAPSPFGTDVHEFMTVSVSDHNVAVLVLTVSAFVALLLYLHSNAGLATKAMFQDREMTEVLGYRTRRTTWLLMAVSGGLVGIAGLLVGPILSVNPDMGTRIALVAFVGAVLGGLGRLSTAVAGAVLLGVVDTLFAAYISSDYRVTVVFVLFIAVLIVRPTGLFGRRVALKF